MAVKYHINPETGRANQCTATVKSCKFAVDGQVPQHYETKTEAKQAYEKEASAEFGQTTSLKKQSSKKDKIEKLSNKLPKTKIEENESLDMYFSDYVVNNKTIDSEKLMNKQIAYKPTNGQSFETTKDINLNIQNERWTLIDDKEMKWKVDGINETDPSDNFSEIIYQDWEKVIQNEGLMAYVETDTKLAGYDKNQMKLF